MLTLESEATRIRTLGLRLVPELVRTEAYGAWASGPTTWASTRTRSGTCSTTGSAGGPAGGPGPTT
ncbi:Scr1 family TA system antitoxin-like transcriptional regulator [Actinomadura sp. CNU-125]|uniref:Scr1 family TA system antitoxin-like transcriptional regulator n=1 Tax=Actinomadura sp. CNU-125 TaxID=1904961 RepID=UPI003967CA4F